MKTPKIDPNVEARKNLSATFVILHIMRNLWDKGKLSPEEFRKEYDTLLANLKEIVESN